MGIDFPTKNELIAGRLQNQIGETYVEEIQKEIGPDTLLYQTVEGLIDAIGKSENQLCLACLTGKYPLKSVQKLAELEKSIVRSRV
jgi:amidophosphoribosyltransferase